MIDSLVPTAAIDDAPRRKSHELLLAICCVNGTYRDVLSLTEEELRQAEDAIEQDNAISDEVFVKGLQIYGEPITRLDYVMCAAVGARAMGHLLTWSTIG